MRLLYLASLASATAAMTCTIVGGGDAQCRSCPATTCVILGATPDGQDQDFSCIWLQGENVTDDSLVKPPP